MIQKIKEFITNNGDAVVICIVSFVVILIMSLMFKGFANK